MHCSDIEIDKALKLLALDLPRRGAALHMGCDGGTWWARVGDEPAVRGESLGAVLCAIARQGVE